MDSDPSYDIYRDLFPGREIPARERKFLERMFALDVSRLRGRVCRFPAYDELRDLLKDECIAPGDTLINSNAVRGKAKTLLAKWFNIRNRDGAPYTDADDRERDMSLRIGVCRKQEFRRDVALSAASVCWTDPAI